MAITGDFSGTNLFQDLEDAGLKDDALVAFNVEVEQNGLPDTPQVRNAYLMFCQHLLQEYGADREMLVLSSVTQQFPLQAAYTLMEHGDEHLQKHDPEAYVDDALIAAAIIEPALQRAKDKTPFLQAGLQDSIMIIAQHDNIMNSKGRTFHKSYMPEGNALHLALTHQKAKMLEGQLEHSLDDKGQLDDHMGLAVILLAQHCHNLDLTGKTTLETMVQQSRKDLILHAKALSGHAAPPRQADVIQFPFSPPPSSIDNE